jgi:hypothetical protein
LSGSFTQPFVGFSMPGAASFGVLAVATLELRDNDASASVIVFATELHCVGGLSMRTSDVPRQCTASGS